MTYLGSGIVMPLLGENSKIERMVLGFTNMILRVPCLRQFLMRKYLLCLVSVVQLLANFPDTCLTSFDVANLLFKIFPICSQIA